MEQFLNDLINSNFKQFINDKTTVVFIDGDSLEEFKFEQVSYNGTTNSLRFILIK